MRQKEQEMEIKRYKEREKEMQKLGMFKRKITDSIRLKEIE